MGMNGAFQTNTTEDSSSLAARRGLKVHLEYAALVFLVAVIAFASYTGIARHVRSGFDCAARQYVSQTKAACRR